VVALVQLPLPACQQRVDRVVFQHPHAAVQQALEEGLRRAEAAGAVVDQVHLHALPLLVDQRLREPAADLVVLQDVGFQVDVVGSGGDGREHGAVGGRTVRQQQHPVADGQRAADDGFFQRQVALEDVGGGAAAGQPLEHRTALRRRQRTLRALHLQRRRLAAARQVGHDGGQAAAATAAAQRQQQPDGNSAQVHGGVLSGAR